MNNFLLFIDTESSGLPRKWDLPYDAEGNWPNAVQFSWKIFRKNGEFVKEENHYIGDTDFDLEPATVKIHGITRDFLNDHGEKRFNVMRLLSNDLKAYQPLIIGHFVELDIHLAGAEYYRTGLENPMPELPSFCTMLASRHLVRNPRQKFLRLGDLYEQLFSQPLENQHNALTDVNATAECFFELMRRKEISETSIRNQKEQMQKERKMARTAGWSIFALMMALLFVIISFCV